MKSQAGAQRESRTAREQFEALYRQHGASWRGFARRRAGSGDRGDEAFAEAMARVVARLQSLEDMTPGYVLTAIERIVIELEARERIRRARESEAALAIRLHGPGSSRPDELTAFAELKARLGDALGELPQEHRRVIKLLFYEDRTQREAASEIGVDRKTLRKRRNEGLAILRRALATFPGAAMP